MPPGNLPQAVGGVSRPLLIDFFCKAGGAAMGYWRAGFDIIGVDYEPQPNYPFPIVLGDVFEVGPQLLPYADAAHASPTCKGYSEMRHAHNAKAHPTQIPQTRAMLQAAGVPYLIENVRAARWDMIEPVMLIGFMFGLGATTATGERLHLERQRLFEASFPVSVPTFVRQTPIIGVYGCHVRLRSAKAGGRRTADFPGEDKKGLARQALGIDWPMTFDELSEAIPPAYTEHLGRQLMARLRVAVAA